MERIKNSVMNAFKELMRRKHLYILLVVVLVLYLINYHPNISEYLDEILQELNSLIIGAVLTTLIVEKITEGNARKQRKETLKILERSMLENLFLIIREFHNTFMEFNFEYPTTIDFGILVKNDKIDVLSELFKTFELAEYNKRDKAIEEYLNQLEIYFNDIFKNDDYFVKENLINDLIPSYKDNAEFYDRVKRFSKSINSYFNEYKMIHVSNFLTLGQDENEKMKLILNFNNFINKFERNINKYLKLAFNKLNYEIAEENEYNNPKELIMNDKATNKDIPVYGVFI